MHIRQKNNSEICSKLKVDTWTDEPVKNNEGKAEQTDNLAGKADMKDVKDTKKYLGSIISHDMKTSINI